MCICVKRAADRPGEPSVVEVYRSKPPSAPAGGGELASAPPPMKNSRINKRNVRVTSVSPLFPHPFTHPTTLSLSLSFSSFIYRRVQPLPLRVPFFHFFFFAASLTLLSTDKQCTVEMKIGCTQRASLRESLINFLIIR